MDLAPGAILGGKYRIERPLARGGMGSLWVARHVQLGSAVAIKFLDASFAASPAHRARFEREARAAATLRSPHVVQVHDYGFEGPSPYIVMELLEGEDLGHRLHRVRRMNVYDTGRVLAQVARALRRAHEAGIAHRDLKPANLFLARVDDEEVVKVLDFGIAKEQHAVLGDATRTGEVIGSPHYMSPEQVRAERDVDHRSDLWSLGVILYRMLVGVLPFPGDQLGPVLARILTDPIPIPSQAVPDLPRSLDSFFARALARDRLQRFQSIGELVEAFQAAVGVREALPSISFLPGPMPMAGAGAAAWGPPPASPMAPGAFTPVPPPMEAGPPGGPMAGSGPITGSSLITASGPISGPPASAGSGPITGSGSILGGSPGSHTGPPTGSVTAGGFVSSGASPKPRGAGVLIAIGALVVAAGAAVVVALFVLRSSSDDAGSGAELGAPVASATTSVVAIVPSVEPAPSVVEPAPSVIEPAPPVEPAPSVEPASSAAVTASAAPRPSSPATAGPAGPAPKPSVVKPKATAKPKEKWF